MVTIFKTGYTTIIARPNVGKSTLLNEIIGQKVAITTNTAQTTRKNIRGIFNNKTSQIIFVDTPGIHKPLNELGEILSLQTQKAIKESDLIIFLVDGNFESGKGDLWIYENCLKNIKKPILLVLNKIDTIKNEAELEKNLLSYKKLFENDVEYVEISAKTGKNIDVLIDKISNYLPNGPKLYPDDTITDQNMRMISSEIVREKIILNTKEEVPHSVAVLIDAYRSEEKIDKIKATIFVASNSQKGILIGKNGLMLKKIGTEARLEIEKIIEKKVFLELFVKVQKNWQKDKKALKMLGLDDNL